MPASAGSATNDDPASTLLSHSDLPLPSSAAGGLPAFPFILPRLIPPPFPPSPRPRVCRRKHAPRRPAPRCTTADRSNRSARGGQRSDPPRSEEEGMAALPRVSRCSRRTRGDGGGNVASAAAGGAGGVLRAVDGRGLRAPIEAAGQDAGDRPPPPPPPPLFSTPSRQRRRRKYQLV